MSKAATLSQANSNKKLISLLQAKPNDNSSAAIENCLKEGADANARDWYNSSALVIAIHNKHDYLAISHLLNYGANPNDLDAHHTVLWHAIYNNHSLPTIKLLIDKGADPNLGGTKYIAESPLSLALAQKSLEKVITLIEYNASTNGMGHKLLSLALMQKNLEAAQYLVDKGVNINGIGQDRPIDTAIFSEDLENVKFMVAQKADLTNTLSKCIKNNLKEIGEYLALNGAPWDTKEYNGFHYMTEKVGRFTILKSLKTSGTDTIKKIENYLKLQDSQDITQKIIDENSPKDVLKIFNLLKIKYTYKNDKFILTTQTAGYEPWDNKNNIKEESRTHIIDNRVYNAKTKELIICSKSLYVVDKNGELFVTPDINGVHHSYILRGTEGKTKLDDISLYGYGKPIACVGHITINNGVIEKIDNWSGHYRIKQDQFIIGCKHLYDHGVLTEATKISLFECAENLELNFECAKKAYK